MESINRRQVLAGAIAGGLAALSLGSADAAEEGAKKGRRASKAAAKAVKAYKNEDFYKDGKFDVAAAKEAYYDMMRRFGYPIVDRLRTEDFWSLDFGMGKFLEVGMAGIFWVNNKEHNYFGHEIYLLPGQMIPEHAHVKTAEAGAKLEAWQPRYGFIYIYGEGTPTPGVEERIPPSHKECAKARTEKILKPGEVAGLSKPEEKHWMRAGPEGAIVTEYATYHDGKGLRFSHPKVVF
jgi:D-lyxose ketol-isomerase